MALFPIFQKTRTHFVINYLKVNFVWLKWQFVKLYHKLCAAGRLLSLKRILCIRVCIRAAYINVFRWPFTINISFLRLISHSLADSHPFVLFILSLGTPVVNLQIWNGLLFSPADKTVFTKKKNTKNYSYSWEWIKKKQP